MTDTFANRIPTLATAELLNYLENAGKFKAEVVALAAAELLKRGHDLSGLEWERIQVDLQLRDAVPEPPRSGWLHDDKGPRRGRIHAIVAGIAATGLGSAILIYLLAAAEKPLPYALDPNNSKRYLREMEVIGGKANLLAYDFNQWVAGLFHGKSLAYTVVWLTVLLAGGFWFVASHRHPE